MICIINRVSINAAGSWKIYFCKLVSLQRTNYHDLTRQYVYCVIQKLSKYQASNSLYQCVRAGHHLTYLYCGTHVLTVIIY